VGVLVSISIVAIVAPQQPAAVQQQTCPVSVDTTKKGKLVVDASADWPPYEYVEDGKMVGIDIARKIAERLGVDLEVRDMKFSALIEAVKRGYVDIVIANMTITSEREKSSTLLYTVDSSVVRRAANIRSIDDLRGKTTGAQVGTVQEDWAEKLWATTPRL
jgi:ABC-type amino acid transport substrate-binding protein